MAKTVTDPYSRYIRATTDVKPRLIAASFGEVGTGKTSFWLGAPGPIVVQTLDQGLEGVIETFAADKEIYVAEYDLGQKVGEDYTHAKAVEARDKFIVDFETAISHARTIVWDRETDVFKLFFFAEFGTDDAFAAAPPKDWDKLKGKIRRLISMAKASDVNFGLIQGMKNEWGQKVNNKTGAKAATQTGNRVTDGMEGVDSLVHINLEHTRANGQMSITVGKSRGPGGREVQDQTFADITFSDLAQLIFPGTDESDWA